MITQVGQIMLYVEDQDQSLQFWTEKTGFVVISEEGNGQGMRWIEIAPTREAQTTIILHNKTLIAQMQPELNLGTPSIMFFTNTLDQMYKDLTDKGVTVGDIVQLPSGRVFNFADDEQNYFAVMEK